MGSFMALSKLEKARPLLFVFKNGHFSDDGDDGGDGSCGGSGERKLGGAEEASLAMQLRNKGAQHHHVLISHCKISPV